MIPARCITSNLIALIYGLYILIIIQQDATLHSLFYLETALHVSGSTITHHQERKQLHLQHLVFVTPLLPSAAIVEELEPVWVCCGWRTPVKLCNVSSCWMYIRILLRCTDPWTVNTVINLSDQYCPSLPANVQLRIRRPAPTSCCGLYVVRWANRCQVIDDAGQTK